MTIHPIRRALLSTREQLVDALQIPFSEEQLDAITAQEPPSLWGCTTNIRSVRYSQPEPLRQ